jgi:hypothetical protein
MRPRDFPKRRGGRRTARGSSSSFLRLPFDLRESSSPGSGGNFARGTGGCNSRLAVACLFRLNARPRNPITTKTAPATMSQWAYCVTSSPSILAANSFEGSGLPAHKQSAVTKAHRDPAIVAALDNFAFFSLQRLFCSQARVSGISLTRSPTLSPASDLAFGFISPSPSARARPAGGWLRIHSGRAFALLAMFRPT